MLFPRKIVLPLGCYIMQGLSQGLPTVDLGYEIHQANSFNTTGQYYNFSDIRYAQDPTGDLRWTPPQPPLQNRTSVQIGGGGSSCPQAFAVWYLCGKALQSGEIDDPSKCNASLITAPNPLEREDCLFLDVIVPKAIFDNKQKAPVAVWIYGGGYAFGKKGDDGNPAGLLARSQELDPEGRGIIYVTLNYRGGAFGFLSGPNLQSNGTANVGLLDQRFALEWVQKYIHLFGGDPSRVTVFGQSAGAGSIMHQITAYGGLEHHSPFQQAILQSPGFQPFPGHWEQDQLLQLFLSHLNVSTIDEARQLPFKTLSAANIEIVAGSPYGTFTFAPAVDGTFVPALPGSLLAQGSFDKSINIMTGFNADETLFFVNSSNTNDAFFISELERSFPDIQQPVLDFIDNTLYPQIFNGSEPYENYFDRSKLSLAEAAFTCNTYFLQKAFRCLSNTYGYRFSVPPAYHGEDVPYTYFNGPNSNVVNDTIALAMQKYLMSFVLTGDPNAQATVKMPIYSQQNLILDLNLTGIVQIQDPNANFRCDWWQKALYY